ncbi:MAG: Glu/Leu/Phe/Val dehydrogenase dimerization domain-containing protein [Mycobacterium sp.]
MDNSVFDRFDAIPGLPHEQVMFCEHAATGLRAIIGIHSTVLGPALGGTRFYAYRDQNSALTDVLRLSRGMTYKAALAGVPFGGGKAVIMGDPAHSKKPALLREYGRFVETLGGRYITAADIGIDAGDLDTIGGVTRHVVGRSAETGGSGNSGANTARGVFHAMRAAATVIWGEPTLTERTVGVEGLGKVGSELIALLLADGARVLAVDKNSTTADRIVERFPEVTLTDHLLDEHLDVYAPCAMGATLTTTTVPELSAMVVCGAANNQLATPDIGRLLHDRGVTWVPDYVANSGGLIQVAGEHANAGPGWVADRIEAIYDTVLSILHRAQREAQQPGLITNQIAESMLAPS